MQTAQRSVMIVSKSSKMVEFIRSAAPQDRFSPVLVVSSAGEARRVLLMKPVDIVLIHTPLPDEFGTKLARDISGQCAVAVIVKPELAEKTAYKLEPFGVVTLPSVLHRSVLHQTVMLLSSSVAKMERLRRNSEDIKKKLREFRTVARAKTLLISERGMTEEQAHRYIEKTAMDSGRKKTDIAEELIESLSGEE